MQEPSQPQLGERDGARLVRIAPNVSAWSPVRRTVEVDELDVQVEVVAVPASEGRAGRFVCREVTVRQLPDGPPVTSEAIRAVPVAQLTNQIGLDHVMSIDAVASDGTMVHGSHQLTPELVERFKLVGPTNEALWWVAYLYQLAVVVNDPPTRSVERALDLPRSTAGRWIALARKRGFLGASEGRGKAGG